MTVRLSEMLPPQTHGAVSALQLSPEKRLSPSQEPVTAVLPSGPQPKKSLLRSPLSRQPAWHEVDPHMVPVSVPERSAHLPQPVPDTAAAKNDPPDDDVAAAGTVPGVSSG